MKMLTIALKDMWRSFRSFFALAFMFGVPILMTLIFSFLFGGFGGENENSFDLPSTDVIIVNLDEGNPYVNNFGHEGETTSTMGEMLVETLKADNFADLMQISTADEVEARQAVDDQTAGLAIIIPPDFTNALIGQSPNSAEIEFYRDPALTMGPDIVKSIVLGVVDGYAASTITLDAVLSVLQDQGISLGQQEQMALVNTLTAESASHTQNSDVGLEIIPPSTTGNSGNDPIKVILRSIMGGMMIFYAFFTGTAAAQTILQEEENGTLARLFTSPTDMITILNGKFLAGFMLIIVQVVVLLVFANLVFGISWGPVLSLGLFSIGLVVLANSFGIFIMSLIKSTKQAGIMYGVVLTFTGMLGISSVFVMGSPIEKAFNFIPLLVPQGWAMEALEASWQANLGRSLIMVAGMLGWAVVLFIIGNLRFKKRFG
jgi:ABC-2 type transport system permease protein